MIQKTVPTSGIYILFFPCDDAQYYIGYSSNIYVRIQQHRARLVAGSHYNYKLTSLYSKYKVLPEYDILEVVTDLSNMSEREIYWIHVFNSYEDGLNLTYGGDGGAHGDAHYMSYYTKEDYLNMLVELTTCNSIKEAAEGLNFNTAIAYSIAGGRGHWWLRLEYPELYDKMLTNVAMLTGGKRKTTTDIYINIFKDLVSCELKHSEICDKYNVTEGIVEGISCGDTHKYLKELFPEEYSLLMNLRKTRRAKSHTGKMYPPVRDPLGNIHIIESNAKAFAISQAVHPGHFGDLLRGKIKQHKGWTLA